MKDYIKAKYCDVCKMQTENIYYWLSGQYSIIICPICKREKTSLTSDFQKACRRNKVPPIDFRQDTIKELQIRERSIKSEAIRNSFSLTSYKCPICGFIHEDIEQPRCCPCCKMPYENDGSEKWLNCKMFADAVPTQKIYDEQGVMACPRCASTDFYGNVRQTLFTHKEKSVGNYKCRKCGRTWVVRHFLPFRPIIDFTMKN